MAGFEKINDFAEDLFNGVHDFSNDTLKLALSNTAPSSESPNPTTDGNGELSNVSQISYANISGGTPTLANVDVQLSSGEASLDADNKVITATGAVPTFRYVYLYNDSATNKELIGYWDYGAGGVTLADTETLTVTISTVLATLS